MKRITLASAFIALLALTSCGNEEQLASPVSATPEAETSPEPTPEIIEEEADPDLPADDDIREYVDAIAGREIGDLRSAEELVVEGSPAAGYLAYFIHSVEAERDSGFRNYITSTVESIDDGLEICSRADGEELCTDYEAFTGEMGLIYGFEVQGEPVADRLIMGSGSTVEGPGGVSAELISSYRNSSGTHTIVSYIIRSGDQSLMVLDPSFRSPEGRSSKSEQGLGVFDLPANSMSHFTAWFPVSDLGGELHLELMSDDFHEMVDLVVPIGE